MLPLRLELRNFLAYRQPDPIVFDGIHLACLTGPNGAGKSSLLDAITWALWGKARVRSDDDLIHQGQSDMLVQLDFAQGETSYRVVRKRQMGRKPTTGKSVLELYVWDAPQNRFNLISEGVRETQRRLDELLRLDYDTFVHSAFLQQGRADAFTLKTPGERKDILAEILGLEQWRQYEDRAKAVLTQIDHNLGVITYQLDEIMRQEAEEPALRRDLAVAEAAHADAQALLAEAEARYAEVAGAQEQMNAAQARLAQAQHRIRQRQADLAEIDAELSRHTTQLARLQGIVDQRDLIEAGYAELQAARDADQQLGEKLQAMSDIKDRLHDVTARIEAARAELEAQASIHRDRMETAGRTAAELDVIESDLADLGIELARLEAEQQRRDDLREAIRALSEERAGLQATNRTLYEEMQTIKTRLETIQAAEAVCPLCGQPLDDHHKAQLLADLQAEGTARGDTYRAHRERTQQIDEQVGDYRTAIEAIETELRRLDALRDRAAALRARRDDALAAGNALQTEQNELTTLETMLASGDYARELQAQRETIQAELDALGYDPSAHSAARERLEALHDYERRQHDLASALDQLPEVQANLEAAETRRVRWLAVLEEEQREAKTARQEIDELDGQVEEARRREEDVRRRRTEEGRARESVNRVQQQLSALEGARQRKAELERQRAELGEQKNIYEELRAAFSKNGVPAMIIEAAIPELEDTANRLLTRMTDGRMHVRFETQREKRTGGVIETLDILISDELGTRSYESYSGGEAFRVNFAIRVALSQMLARRAGAQLRTLFIDEGFGTQDEVGRQRLVEAITAVQDHFDLLLAITHIDDLRDAFPVQVEVTKTPNGSLIYMR